MGVKVAWFWNSYWGAVLQSLVCGCREVLICTNIYNLSFSSLWLLSCGVDDGFRWSRKRKWWPQQNLLSKVFVSDGLFLVKGLSQFPFKVGDLQRHINVPNFWTIFKSLADGWDCIVSDYGSSLIRSVCWSSNISSAYGSSIISWAYGSSLISLAYGSSVISSAYGGVPEITTIQHKSAPRATQSAWSWWGTLAWEGKGLPRVLSVLNASPGLM